MQAFYSSHAKMYRLYWILTDCKFTLSFQEKQCLFPRNCLIPKSKTSNTWNSKSAKKLFISDKNIYNVCLKVSLHHTSHTRHRTSVRNAIWADESTFIPHICSSLSHYQCLRSVWASVWQFLLWMHTSAYKYKTDIFTHTWRRVCALWNTHVVYWDTTSRLSPKIYE